LRPSAQIEERRGEQIMKRTMRFRLMWLVAAAPGLLLLAGCGDAGHAKFTPTKDEARSSLEAALTAWRDGRPFGPLETTPPVRIADSLWQGGQQIESFQIGDEQSNDDGTKHFPVKLTIKKTKAVQEVEYVVHGRDPVWVFSGTDYQRMIDMDNGPQPTRNRSSAIGGRASGGRSQSR
jgi:hypothetical protein